MSNQWGARRQRLLGWRCGQPALAAQICLSSRMALASFSHLESHGLPLACAESHVAACRPPPLSLAWWPPPPWWLDLQPLATKMAVVPPLRPGATLGVPSVRIRWSACRPSPTSGPKSPRSAALSTKCSSSSGGTGRVAAGCGSLSGCVAAGCGGRSAARAVSGRPATTRSSGPTAAAVHLCLLDLLCSQLEAPGGGLAVSGITGKAVES